MNQLKKLHFFLLLILLTSCGPTIYKAQGFEESKSKVKLLAILPYNVLIDTKRLPKNIKLETLANAQKKTGFDMQSKCYTWFLQKQEKYTVSFQDVDRTNALLTQANIDYEKLSSTDKGELCKLLGVDAVISGKASLSKPMSEGGAIVLAVLVGSYGATNSTAVTLTIHDSGSNLLWKYDYVASGGVGSPSENLTRQLMKSASRKFPYKIKK